MGACSTPGNASPSTERGRLASCPSSPSMVSSSLCFADKTVRADGVTQRSIGTYIRIARVPYIHQESRVESCSLRHPSIHPDPSTAIRAHVTTVGHMYSCDQLVPKGNVLLAVIKPHVSHMYVLFVYKVS